MGGPTPRRRWIRALAGAVFTLPFGRRALAWIPPADFLLGRVADRRKNVKTLSVRGIRTFVGRSFEGGKQDVMETLQASVGDGAYRLERRTPRGVYLEISDGVRRVSVVEGRTGAVEADPRPLDRLLFTGASREDLVRAAVAFGVNLDVVGLGRTDGRVVWILGAKDGDTASPQLRIDKERNLPLLLSDPRAKRSLRFEGWDESGGAGVVPARLFVLSGDDVVESLKVEETKVNPKLAGDLFKPELAAAPSPAPTASPKPR